MPYKYTMHRIMRRRLNEEQLPDHQSQKLQVKNNSFTNAATPDI